MFKKTVKRKSYEKVSEVTEMTPKEKLENEVRSTLEELEQGTRVSEYLQV